MSNSTGIDGRSYENTGKFTIRGFGVIENAVSRSSTSIADSVNLSINYRRLGKSLWELDNNWNAVTEYKPVRLDSTIPCGEPFTLFPKPTGWTLF